MVADLEAGIGTVTRLHPGTVDVAVVVVEPTPRSIEVGSRAAAAAYERGVGRVVVVANRVRPGDDLSAVTAAVPQVEVVTVPDDPAVAEADRRGVAPLDHSPDGPAVTALRSLAARLEAGWA